MTSVLVANRGEIALRIVTACQKLGFESVLAVSAADADALPARLADRVVRIGPAEPAKSYLRPELVVQAAVSVGADVVHPGYGFLSENADFIELVQAHGVALAGPRPETVRAVGDKSAARAVAMAADVPVAPAGSVADVRAALALAAQIGYPAVLKAVYGGGGRGIHVVEDDAQLHERFPLAAAEARAAFGNDALYLERYYAGGRHVEVQIFGDGHGHVLVLGDRDCSVQRRHQKLIEECPAPNLNSATRALLHDAARRLGEYLSYRGAGTCEFLVEGDTGSGAEPATVVFLEINARIQVEHPVTEEAFGVDLVAAQLLLAVTGRHNLPECPALPPAHAIECRITAEDPGQDFRPSPGRITRLQLPRGPGLRVDTHIFEGYLFPPYYDSLMAKVVARGHDRATALWGMRAALDDVLIEGVQTSTDVHRAVLDSDAFTVGGVTTQWLPTIWPPPAHGPASGADTAGRETAGVTR